MKVRYSVAVQVVIFWVKTMRKMSNVEAKVPEGLRLMKQEGPPTEPRCWHQIYILYLVRDDFLPPRAPVVEWH